MPPQHRSVPDMALSRDFPLEASSLAMAHGVYVHVPWCRVHCPYCAFNVAVDPSPPWDRFVQAVLRDHRAMAPAFSEPADTLYLGGGTPSLLPPAMLGRLIEGIAPRPGAEITLELNPGTVDLATLHTALRLGVTRLSLGIQTFNRRHAQRLGRDHDLRQAQGLLEMVAALPVQTWSLDLIFSLPEQTMAELEADLDRVLSLAPPHVSLYGLTYESGTPFAARLAAGRLKEQTPEDWRRFYDRITQRLQNAGWERYEISNFARPGHRSRHNQATWRGGFYAGLGPGAHGYLPPTAGAPWGTRTIQAPDIGDWLSACPAQVEVLDLHQSASDLILSTLRHVDGLPLQTLGELGLQPDQGLVSALSAAGLLIQRQQHLRLTPRGAPLADGLTARLIDSLSPC